MCNERMGRMGIPHSDRRTNERGLRIEHVSDMSSRTPCCLHRFVPCTPDAIDQRIFETFTFLVPYVLSLSNPMLASMSTWQWLSHCCSYHQNMFRIRKSVTHKPMQCIKLKGWGMDVRATLSSHTTNSLACRMVSLGSSILECLLCDRCPSTKHRLFDTPNFAKTPPPSVMSLCPSRIPNSACREPRPSVWLHRHGGSKTEHWHPCKKSGFHALEHVRWNFHFVSIARGQNKCETRTW